MRFLTCTSDKIFARPSVIPYRLTDDDDDEGDWLTDWLPGDEVQGNGGTGWTGEWRYDECLENSITAPVLWPHSFIE